MARVALPGSSASNRSSIVFDGEQATTDKCYFDPLSRRRQLFDLLGLALIAYDTFTIPLEVLSVSLPFFSLYIRGGYGLASCTYWTLNFCLGGFIGYYNENGDLVTGVLKTGRAYMKCWGVFDLATLICDFICVLLDRSTKDSPLITLSYGFRLTRIIRVRKQLETSTWRVSRSSSLILLNLVEIFLFTLVLCHISACGWYFIGKTNPSGSRARWIDEFQVTDRSWGYRYSLCFHWALTHFTVSSMEVRPTNTVERFFDVTIAIVGLVVFSSYLGNVMTSFDGLRKERRDDVRQMSMMRRFLDQKGVSQRTRAAIFYYLNVMKSKRNMVLLQEGRVELIAVLPAVLQEALRWESYVHVFADEAAHPLMSWIKQQGDDLCRRLCNTALKESECAKAADLFGPCTPALQMYFVRSGELDFATCAQEPSVSAKLSPSTRDHPPWCCEVALWLKWTHDGRMTATRHAELIELSAHDFETNIKEHHVPTLYANFFIKYLRRNPKQTCDVMLSSSTREDLESLLREANKAMYALRRRRVRCSVPDSRNILTRESKFMISARFNTEEMISICKELKIALENLGFTNVLLVEAGAGDQFGPMTMRYLKECDAMIGMITHDYGERTSSAYCSYYELKHYIENRYGCGASQIQKFFPIKLCESWPPPSRGDCGAALCSLAFTQDLVWTVDMHNRQFDAKEAAEAIATHVPCDLRQRRKL